MPIITSDGFDYSNLVATIKNDIGYTNISAKTDESLVDTVLERIMSTLSKAPIVQHKCHNCGAPIRGNECEYCGTIFLSDMISRGDS